MCGRYYRRSDKQKIAEAFHVGQVDDFALPPWDYNVAPTTNQPIIRNSRDTGERELVLLRWGLIPFFTKSIADVKGLSTINARAETVAKSPTYREPFKKRRCLVPASGFYEWKRLDPKNKQPFAFDLSNGNMMAFAGLWTDGRIQPTESGCKPSPYSLPKPMSSWRPSTTGCLSSCTPATSTAGWTAARPIDRRSICCCLSPPLRWRHTRPTKPLGMSATTVPRC